MLAVRNMHNDHSGKNQAKTILSILDKYLPKAKLRYFSTDNAFTNNTCITKIIDLICPNLDAKKKRLKCIKHIINLIAKAFIFGNKSESFKANIAIAKSINNLEITIKL